MTIATFQSANQTILAVEDELSSLIMLKTVLQKIGYNVLEARDYTMAKDILQDHQVDIILLDIVLPDIDGYEICKKLKKHKNSQDIPVIFITSLNSDFEEEKGFMAGAVDFLRKPINPVILKARVANHLHSKQQRKNLEKHNLQLAKKSDDYKKEAVRRIQVEEELLEAYNGLEDRVKERTKELREASRTMAEQIKRRKLSERNLQKNEVFLARQNARLEEINVALKVLLDKREKDQRDFEERIIIQVKQLIEPYINKLQQSRLSERQRDQLDILSKNLDEIASPFTRNVFTMNLQLTPVEIQIANLVKQGKSSKEIAELMGITPGTADLHRKNIRKKCGITHKKVNLRTYLLSFQI